MKIVRTKEETEVFKDIRLALERIERRQRGIMERLDRIEQMAKRPDEGIGPYGIQDRGNRWLESGLDNILAYQAGKKKGDEQA